MWRLQTNHRIDFDVLFFETYGAVSPQMTAFNFSKQNLFYLIVSHDKRPTHFSSSHHDEPDTIAPATRLLNLVDYPKQYY